jgi:hypothetical protein
MRGMRGMPTTKEATAWLWFGAAATYIVVLTMGMTRISYDIWGALVLGPILAALSLPVLRRAVRRDDPTLVTLFTVAFVAKLGGAVLRYVITFNTYGAADADEYHVAGSALANGFWRGELGEVMRVQVPDLVGTEFIRLTTGILYIVTGPTRLGGFLVYAVLSFWGLFFFTRALRVAFPEADHRRYALLLLLLPSLLYWPSSIGKEAWMCFTLGLATYGVALILRHNPLGYPYAGFGMLGTAMVRPHVTMLCFVALFMGYVLRRRSWRQSMFGPVGKVAGIVMLLAASGFALGATARFFKLDAVDSQAVDSVLNYTENQSAQGGSEFESTPATSPAQYPLATVTVLFRPFPWEAGNSQAFGAAAEGLLLVGVCLTSWRRLVRLPRFFWRTPYVVYCVAFTAMFIFAFSSISNFGILTRQRTQVFPFFLVLLAIPEPEPRHRGRSRDDADDDAHGRPALGAGSVRRRRQPSYG